ncbi:hypothetical protein JR325_gp171 [Escherichia phage tuntematon]|uniref:Uncharacterized protein n=1 Tax=Escherichia phage tuntematon TaxID=2696455 RepID=A0A6B9X5G1_9CAUD|nr:hypothetical protein JR325_gp171 [Escherichia phage tuntematon]QHR72134.1 hypothetical protein tuntematon_278 [Escherichia phage tuntematon]
MSCFTKAVSICKKQYESDYGIFNIPVDHTKYCSCGGRMKKTVIYADSGDELVPVMVCKACHSVKTLKA